MRISDWSSDVCSSDLVDVPMATLLSAGYNEGRRRLIGDRASLDLRPGTIAGYDRSLDAALGVDATVDPRALERMGVGEPTVSKSGVASGDTVHRDTINRDEIRRAPSREGGCQYGMLSGDA